MIQQSGHYEFDENLDEFYDYKKLRSAALKRRGRDVYRPGVISHIRDISALRKLWRAVKVAAWRWEAWYDHSRFHLLARQRQVPEN